MSFTSFSIIALCITGFLVSEYSRYQRNNSEVIRITRSRKGITFENKDLKAFLEGDDYYIPENITKVGFFCINPQQNIWYVSFGSNLKYKLTTFQKKQQKKII